LSRSALQQPGLAGTDGYAIMHVHYQGTYPDADRAVVTQINIRHTWHSGLAVSERFHKKCVNLNKWREKKGACVLGSREAPRGWQWREGAERNLKAFTPCLQDLLQQGERCTRVVRKKYVDLVAAAVSLSAPAPTNTAPAAAPTVGAAAQAPYEEPDWSGKPAPAPMEFPFTILFVGVDNGDRQAPELNLNAEFEAINTALRMKRLDGKVRVRQIFYSNWADVMKTINDEAPDVLHLGCHGTTRGIELFRKVVTPEMIRQLQDWNAHARATNRRQIRFVVINSCESDGPAMEFATFVEFVIGHLGEVEDKAA